MMDSKINIRSFFSEWKGHPIAEVALLRKQVRQRWPSKPIIYLAGDSSLDNKYWVHAWDSPRANLLQAHDVPEIYHLAFDRPTPKPDIAFWLNHLLGDRATTLNLAVEESMLRERDRELLAHDKFIRDNIRSDDILIVSVGANDIALRPTLATIRHLIKLCWFTPRRRLEDPATATRSLRYFIRMFKDQVEAYISRIVEKQKPKAIIVCMIYFPLESRNQASWADFQLKTLGYGCFPQQLQSAIRAAYEVATKRITIRDTRVIPCPLFQALDGKREGDYVERVEPSAEGGLKIATQLEGLLREVLTSKV